MGLVRCGTVFSVSAMVGGGCAGGGVPLGAVLVLSWCGEVSLRGIQSSSASLVLTRSSEERPTSGHGWRERVAGSTSLKMI